MDETKKTTETINERTEYEISHDRKSRTDLMPILMESLNEVDDMEFHAIYDLVWSLTVGKTLYRSFKSSDEFNKKEIEDLKKEISEMKKQSKREAKVTASQPKED